MAAERERIYQIVRAIPERYVATYGDVARLAGKPNGAREVGWALSSLPDGNNVPWWRVVNAQGAVSCRSHGADLQAELLRAEGVEVDNSGRLALAKHRWDGEPRTDPAELAGT